MLPGFLVSTPYICGLRLFLILSFAPRGFSPGTPVFPSPKFQFDEELGRRRTTLWMCYLQIIIYLFILLQGMNRTVLLHCPISAEIRTVDSQSDLRILSWLCLIEKDLVRIIQLKHSPFSPTPLCTLLTPQNFA